VTTGSALLLDMDGTLVDSVVPHTLAWSQALDEVGLSRPMSSIQPLIGMGGPQLLEALLGHDHPDARQAHDEHFQRLRRHVHPLPGAADLLERARSSGHAVYVVTSSKPDDAEALLSLLGGPPVDGIVHGDDVARTKPHPDLFQQAIAKWDIDPKAAVAVGDSEWDVRAAQDAGLQSIGVLTGGTPAERLLGVGALAVYRSCRQLAEHIARLGGDIPRD
jgi:phosphoglycolate phosphatase